MKTAIKPAIAIILATILLTQIISVVQLGVSSSSGSLLQYSSAQLPPQSGTETNNNPDTTNRKAACDYRTTIKSLSEQTYLDDYETANYGFNSGFDSGYYDYKNGNGNTLNFSVSYHDPIHLNNKLNTIAYQHGYICGYGPPVEAETQQPKGDVATDQTCPCTGATCPNPNLVQSTFPSLSKGNIRPVSYTFDAAKSYQNPEIIKVDFLPPQPSGCFPIIFIPGIGGSELFSGAVECSRCESGYSGWTIWPYSTGVGQSGRDLPQLDLPVTGIPPDTTNIRAGSVIRSPTLAGDVYGSFIDSIKQIEYNHRTGQKYQETGKSLSVFPYDWRLNITDHVEALRKHVDEVMKMTRSTQVILITHSMGGLIATAFLSDPENAKKVDTLITIAAPYYGAPKPYYALTMGYNFDNPTVDPRSFKISGQNWPSVYQLLPRFDFVRPASGKGMVSNNDVYSDKTLYTSVTRKNPGYPEYTLGEHEWKLNKGLLENARSFWKDLPSLDAPLSANLKHYAIVGTGVKTLTGYWIEELEGYDVKYPPYDAMPMLDKLVRLHPEFEDGDGQVPRDRAVPKGVTGAYYIPYIPIFTVSEKTTSGKSELNWKPVNSIHGYLPGNKYVQSIVGQIISGKTSEATTAKDSIVRSTNKPLDFSSPIWINSDGTIGGERTDPDKDRYINFEIHSDVHTTITQENTAGILGYDENGQIVESLPGTFLSMDGIEYASLGDLAGNYKVSVKGIRDGNFTLGIKISKGNGNQAVQFSYPKVLVKKGTVAQFTITPDKVTTSSIPVLKVNNDGIITDVVATVGSVGTGGNMSTSAAGGEVGVGTVQNGFLTYDNCEYGFKIKYPNNWPKNEIPEGVNFVSASEVFNVWGFKNLYLSENEKKTLDENVKGIIDERMKKQSNFRLEESKDIEFNGLPAHKILFTYTDSVAGPTRVMEVIVINGNVRYELYFAASTELFTKSLPTAEQMFDSFELVGIDGGTKINASDETIIDTDPADSPPTGSAIDAGDETIIDTDPAEPPTSSKGQEPSLQAVLISDNFDSENQGTGELEYSSFMNWIPKEGTVDLIGNGFYDVPGGKGLYVDLDGGNLDAGILESKEEFTLSPGNYVLEFDISGSLFLSDTNDVKVQLGNAFSETFTKKGDSPFERIVRTIAMSQPTTAKLSFDHSGGDNVGIKLDNVKLYKSETDRAPTTTSDGSKSAPTSQQQGQQQQQRQTSKPAKADLVDYENPDFRLAMKYPSNWAVRENPDNVVFTSPIENEADAYLESLYVYHLGDIPLGKSEEETLKSNIEATIDYREPYSDFQLLSSNNIEFNGNTAGQIEYTYTDTNIGNTKAKEIIAIDGNDRYDILFIANADQYLFYITSCTGNN